MKSLLTGFEITLNIAVLFTLFFVKRFDRLSNECWLDPAIISLISGFFNTSSLSILMTSRLRIIWSEKIRLRDFLYIE